MTDKRTNEEIRERSGHVTFNNALEVFLYMLMRDHLPTGKVEMIVTEAVNAPMPVTFTNGWLAKYANDLASSLIENEGGGYNGED